MPISPMLVPARDAFISALQKDSKTRFSSIYKIHKRSIEAAEKLELSDPESPLPIRRTLLIAQIAEFFISREKALFQQTQTPFHPRIGLIGGKTTLTSIVDALDTTLHFSERGSGDWTTVSLEAVRLKEALELFIERGSKVRRLRTVVVAPVAELYGIPPESLQIHLRTYESYATKINDRIAKHHAPFNPPCQYSGKRSLEGYEFSLEKRSRK